MAGVKEIMVRDGFGGSDGRWGWLEGEEKRGRAEFELVVAVVAKHII